jgi:hypothetical protein
VRVAAFRGRRGKRFTTIDAWACLDARPIEPPLVFWANSGPSGGQQVTISAAVNFNGNGLPSYTIASLPANTWQKYEIPLAALGVQGQSNITNFGFMNTSGAPAPTFYVDDIWLSPAYPSTLLRNLGAQPAPGPIYLVVGGMSLNTTLANANRLRQGYGGFRNRPRPWRAMRVSPRRSTHTGERRGFRRCQDGQDRPGVLHSACDCNFSMIARYRSRRLG